MQNNDSKAEQVIDEAVAKGWTPMIEKLENWYNLIIKSIPNLIAAILVFIIVLILSKYLSKLILKLLERTKMQRSIKSLISRAVSIIIIAIGFFLVLGILDLDKALNTILAGAGVVSLAVGLALQGSLSNTYSGIVLSFIHDLRFGDWVETNGINGEVVNIDLRAVTIKQPDNNVVYMPNKLVVENAIINHTINSQTRVILQCGVGYGSDLAFVKKLTVDTIVKTVSTVNKAEDVIFFFTEFGDSSINYELRFFVDATKALQTAVAKSEAMIAIKAAYDKNGVNIPFPIRTLDLPKRFLDSLDEPSKNKTITEE